MNRPTCETCAYWHQWKKDSKNYGDCHKRAPTLVGEVRCGPEWPDDLAHDDWCGEHHLFPAYIASLTDGEVAPETKHPSMTSNDERDLYVLPNGDTINLPDVAYVQLHALPATTETARSSWLVAVGMRTRTPIQGVKMEWQAQMRFDGEYEALKARDTVVAAVMAHAKSQPSQDPLERP